MSGAAEGRRGSPGQRPWGTAGRGRAGTGLEAAATMTGERRPGLARDKETGEAPHGPERRVGACVLPRGVLSRLKICAIRRQLHTPGVVEAALGRRDF